MKYLLEFNSKIIITHSSSLSFRKSPEDNNKVRLSDVQHFLTRKKKVKFTLQMTQQQIKFTLETKAIWQIK